MLTPFRKILIANRGEIALRVMRTAKAMGFRTVAVFSEADRDGLHVRGADQAVAIGGSLPGQSYLNIENIIAAARRSGADAVHPGYGFLAENAAFAAACRDAGLIFIGPSPEAIVAMGNKAGAKRLMLAAGVPCIPGYQGEDQSPATLKAEAAKIGFPVMIKASAGGGGRGMRLVETSGQFDGALASAQSEAQGAFGNPEVILEKAVVDPRHIEIQIFADRHGHAIHLGERDCSIQRRHQKVIEEAPSPAVSPDLRAQMGAAAVAAAKAIDYEGAGTLEFLLDSQGRFYFMEMNTRLQVEHPVTEAITGLDLVELQLRVAGGEALPVTQADITFRGHAIEARLCAENTTQGFVPQSGRIALWRAPPALRVEHALESGGEISPYYDSMIAKVISFGETREEARRKLVGGLEDMVALGLHTSQKFLINCLEHRVFAEGGATTGFVGDHGEDLTGAVTHGERSLSLAGVLLYATATGHGMSELAHRLPVAFRFEMDGQPAIANVSLEAGNTFQVAIGEHRHAVHILALDGATVRFEIDGVIETAAYVRDGLLLLVGYRGAAFRIDDLTHAAAAAHDGRARDGKIKALMNGRVMAVQAAVGDLVQAGQPIITLEAMKMEHVHTAPITGRVAAILAELGDQVSIGRLVAEVEPADAAVAADAVK
ncbi:acetyl/propionyl/methylcrotonyl-CoA carboxylase subunit alpha [Phreatobacter stygius]|uniref:Acetyl-CoA carboxylase biotin carboxylase subunit n=1 Tax=Phreatobacter stygius TaxID=1940610 RepID=A0A4D7BBF5_9HYPH|nr:acetyl-CoA carboxylase biotin carboxylase subunit [Phreatobacter stygius]QCI68020.1 acetyl-CoA carboxylase biotin carboxylase subunit [Phreatobacter stygius]